MGLKDKLKGAWNRVSDLDDESASAKEQASAGDRIPYKKISKEIKELMKKNVDVVGRKILIPGYYIVYFSEEDREMRKDVEDVMCEELREELYPEMRKINPEQTKRDILIEAGTDPDVELGKFRIEYRMKRPAPGERKPTASPKPKPTSQAAPPPDDDKDLMATVIEQPTVSEPNADDMATVIQTPAGTDSFSITVKSPNSENAHQFTKKKISIGRASQDDVVLESEDFSISRGHALLELRDNKFFLTPVGVNGTHLNGEELALKTDVEVNRGDEIKIMNYTLTIS